MSSTIHTAPSPDDPAAPVEAGHSQFSASAPSFSVRSAPAAPTAGSSLSASSPITFASAGAASADSTAVVAGAGSVDASAASAVPAEFPEPTGAQAWLDYDETEDYREHSKWSLVRSRPFKHKLKWFAYKVADGADRMGEAISDLFGITDSRFQYVVDAHDRQQWEKAQEAERQRQLNHETEMQEVRQLDALEAGTRTDGDAPAVGRERAMTLDDFLGDSAEAEAEAAVADTEAVATAAAPETHKSAAVVLEAGDSAEIIEEATETAAAAVPAAAAESAAVEPAAATEAAKPAGKAAASVAVPEAATESQKAKAQAPVEEQEQEEDVEAAAAVLV